jgi:hypothetical protein
MNFRTNVDVNHFYYYHTRNEFLKLCPLFSKLRIYIYPYNICSKSLTASPSELQLKKFNEHVSDNLRRNSPENGSVKALYERSMRHLDILVME